MEFFGGRKMPGASLGAEIMPLMLEKSNWSSNLLVYENLISSLLCLHCNAGRPGP